MLHSWAPTAGSIEAHHEVENLTFQVVDCGGAREERKTWAPQFQEIRCLLFTVPLAGYHLSLAEDKTKVCDCPISLGILEIQPHEQLFIDHCSLVTIPRGSPSIRVYTISFMVQKGLDNLTFHQFRYIRRKN